MHTCLICLSMFIPTNSECMLNVWLVLINKKEDKKNLLGKTFTLWHLKVIFCSLWWQCFPLPDQSKCWHHFQCTHRVSHYIQNRSDQISGRKAEERHDNRFGWPDHEKQPNQNQNGRRAGFCPKHCHHYVHYKLCTLYYVHYKLCTLYYVYYKLCIL